MKFEQEAEQLKKAVGGNENIVSLTHCVTRLRMEVKDSTLCNKENIESIHGVKGVIQDGNQIQVVIGAEVKAFFAAMQQKEEKKAWNVQAVLAFVAEVVAPVLPFVIVAGILRGVLFYVPLPFVADGINIVLSYGVPIALCYGVVKKAGGSEMMGLLMGLLLVMPAMEELLQGLYPWLPVSLMGEPLPALCTGLLTAGMERFFTKHSPASLSFVLVPLCTLTAVLVLSLVILPVAICISHGLYWLLSYLHTGILAIVCGGLFALFYPVLVTTGFQHIVTILDLLLMAESAEHGTFIWPLIALANIAIGSAAFVATKLEKKESSVVYSCFTVGVTEPALYGICRKYHYPLVSAMAGGCIAGVFCCGSGVSASAIGIGGIPAILSILPEHAMPYLLSIGLALVLPSIFVIVMKRFVKEKKQATFVLPLSGAVRPLSMCADSAFSSGMMGEGFVIEPEEGMVYAPCDGEVSVVFPTGHAYGLKSDNGYEVLIHIGMDTVALGGKGFEPCVKQGDHVKQGDVLCKADLSLLKAEGKSCVTPVVFTDGTHVKLLKSGTGKAKESGFVKVEEKV